MNTVSLSQIVKTLLLAAVAAAFASCGSSEKSTFKPNVIGANGEILVVMNDPIKNDTAGAYITSMLAEPFFTGVAPLEPLFDVQTVPNGLFNEMMHTFRNLMIVEVIDTLATDTVQFYSDVWARPQAVVTARARSKQALLQLVDRNRMKILSFITKAERDRLIAFNRRSQHVGLMTQISDQWGIDIVLPNTFSKCTPRNTSDMSWFMIDTDQYQTGLFIYSLPYVGEGSFSREYLLDQRDKLLLRNIEGPEGSYMCTEVRFGLDEIMYNRGKFNGMDVAELRGAWRTEGYVMGGPFILRAVHDTINNRMIVTDGYVYYPSQAKKRNHIRQLEAVMYTLSIAERKE